jgi:hypothetical protein
VAQEAVKFSYFLIKASKSETGETEIPDSLKSLAAVLKQTGYTKFEALGANTLSAQPGKAVSVALTKEYSMTLTPQRDGKTCSLRVQIVEESGGKKKVILDTTVPLKKGKPIIVTGPAIDGGKLVLVFAGQ